MKVKRIHIAYFSPTSSTRRLLKHIGHILATQMEIDLEEYDFTLPQRRQYSPEIRKTDLFIMGLPVYAGRLPNLMLQYLSGLFGNEALAIPIVLYGNRSYGNALIELRDLLENHHFHTIAAAAFVGQHSFSNLLAQGRPDQEDMKKAEAWMTIVKERIRIYEQLEILSPVEVSGTKAPDYGGYYKPLGEDGTPVNFLKAKPITTNDCIHCKRCAEACPMGSIDPEDVTKVNGICIKCNACIKVCPVHAKRWTDPAYLSHLKYLETHYRTIRAAVALF